MAPEPRAERFGTAGRVPTRRAMGQVTDDPLRQIRCPGHVQSGNHATRITSELMSAWRDGADFRKPYEKPVPYPTTFASFKHRVPFEFRGAIELWKPV